MAPGASEYRKRGQQKPLESLPSFASGNPKAQQNQAPIASSASSRNLGAYDPSQPDPDSNTEEDNDQDGEDNLDSTSHSTSRYKVSPSSGR